MTPSLVFLSPWLPYQQLFTCFQWIVMPSFPCHSPLFSIVTVFQTVFENPEFKSCCLRMLTILEGSFEIIMPLGEISLF